MEDEVREQERKLALALCGDIAKSLIASMPAIRESLQTGKQASFTGTIAFKQHVTKDTEELIAKVNTRTRTPGDEYERKLSLHHGQLSLFEGAPAEEPADSEES